MASYRLKIELREKDSDEVKNVELMFKAPLKLELFSQKLFDVVKSFIPHVTRRFVLCIDVDYFKEGGANETDNNGQGNTRQIQAVERRGGERVNI